MKKLNNSGAVKSKQTSQNIQLGPKTETVFDYERVSPVELKIAKEIINVLREHEKSSINEVIKILERRFNIVEVPSIDVNKSIWHNLTKEENIKGNIQGYLFKKDENANDIKIPIVAFSEPLDKLDDLVQKLVKKIENMKT